MCVCVCVYVSVGLPALAAAMRTSRSRQSKTSLGRKLCGREEGDCEAVLLDLRHAAVGGIKSR